MNLTNWQSFRMTAKGLVPLAKWNGLIDAVRASRIVSVVGGKLQSTPLGTTIVIDGAGGAATAEDPHPWKPYNANGLDVRVMPGTLNNILPTNWNDDLTLSANQTGGWVWLEATINQRGDVSSCVMATGSTVPTPDAPGNDGTIPTTLYATLFSYDSSATGVTRLYPNAQQNLATEVVVTDPGCEEVYRSARIINA